VRLVEEHPLREAAAGLPLEQALKLRLALGFRRSGALAGVGRMVVLVQVSGPGKSSWVQGRGTTWRRCGQETKRPAGRRSTRLGAQKGRILRLVASVWRMEANIERMEANIELTERPSNGWKRTLSGWKRTLS